MRRAPDGGGLEEDDGFAVAEALGLDACAPLGAGGCGRAYLMGDGLVLKLTVDPVEAAFAQLALSGAADGVAPKVMGVWSTRTDGCERVWAILREEVGEVFVSHDPREEPDVLAWWEAWSLVGRGLKSSGPGDVAKGVALWADRSPDLGSFAASMSALSETVPVRFGDMHYDNVGLCRDGRLVVRDLGCFRLSDEMEAGMLSAIEPVPAGPSARAA